MNKTLCASTIGILAAAASTVKAQLFYEPFDYGSASVGQTFANQTGTPTFRGYTNPSTGQFWFDGSINTAGATTFANDNKIVAGGLTPVIGQAPAIGNSAAATVQNAPTSFTAFTPNDVISSGSTIYHSLSFTVNDISNVTVNPASGGGFVYGMTTSDYVNTQANPTSLGASLQIRHDTTGTFQVGLRSGPTSTFAPTSFPVGTTVFLVFAYTINSGAGNDLQQMWVNPSAADFGAATAPAATVSNSLNNVTSADHGLKYIFVDRGGNNALVPKGMQFDEIRADQTWAQVTAPTGSTLSASGGDWSDATQWNSGAGPAPTGSNDFAYFTGAGGTVDVSSNQTVSTLTFRSNSGYTITGSGGTLSAGVINVQAQMDPTGPNIVTAGSQSISANLSLTATTPNLTVNTALGQTLAISGNISNASSGGIALTKNGPGTLSLTGTNTYDGITTINAGVLAIDADSRLGAIGTDPDNNPYLKIFGGTLKFTNSFTLNSRGMQLKTATATIDTNGQSVLYTGKIFTYDGSDTLNIISSSGSGVFQLNNSGSSYRSLAVKSNARLELISSNNDGMLGDTSTTPGVGKANWLTFDGGTIAITTSSTTAGTHGGDKGISLTANGGTFDIAGGLSATFAMTGSGLTGVVGPGNLTVKGAGALNVKAILTNPASGPGLTLDGGTIGFSSAFDTTTPVSLTSNNGTIANAVAGANTVTFSGKVTGAGGMTVNISPSNALTLVLNNNTNDYAGVTRVGSAGTLVTAVSNALPAAGAVSVESSTGTLDIGSTNQSVDSVTLIRGNILGTTGVLSAATSFDLHRGGTINTNGDVNAILGGTATLTKSSLITDLGPNNLITLNMANTYSGGTVVNDGTLAAAVADALPNGKPVTTNGAGSTLHVLANQTISTLDGTGNTTVDSGATLTATHVRQGTLTINTANVAITSTATGSTPSLEAGNNSATSVVNSISIAAGGKLDLTNNDLIVRVPDGPHTDTARALVEGYVKSGFRVSAGADWNGTGIMSSTAASHVAQNFPTALGVLDHFQLPSITSFGGQTVGANDILVKYTWNGDATMDGVVNADDYNKFLDGFVSGMPARWFNGDFTYDGVVNADDYNFFLDGLLAYNASAGVTLSPAFEAQLAEFATANGIPFVLDPTPAPEPTGLAVLGIAGLGMFARRRRKMRVGTP